MKVLEVKVTMIVELPDAVNLPDVRVTFLETGPNLRVIEQGRDLQCTIPSWAITKVKPYQLPG
jgi:hypothetical protein